MRRHFADVKNLRLRSNFEVDVLTTVVCPFDSLRDRNAVPVVAGRIRHFHMGNGSYTGAVLVLKKVREIYLVYANYLDVRRARTLGWFFGGRWWRCCLRALVWSINEDTAGMLCRINRDAAEIVSGSRTTAHRFLLQPAATRQRYRRLARSL